MEILEAQKLCNHLVDLIKEDMNQKHVSNYMLAQKSGISEAHLSYIFNHKKQPSFYILLMISKALDTKLSYFMERLEK
ncbi:helix-turn-helix transcriptional regulator [bacterium]|nr:helix-turn-helix transcriptional regulator [bacterium]MBR1399429.1 helix-turn-helix transcriptional regulator [Alphaproteobacteria bacterium]